MSEFDSTLQTDVLIIGMGPIGCTFARHLVPAGRNVLMIDAGAQLSQRPGENLKNAFVYQREIDRFTWVIQGNMNQASVVPETGYSATLNPFAYRPDRQRPTIRHGQNPHQDPAKNLPGAAVTYAVGGMFTHWTCNTPRYHPQAEWHDAPVPFDELSALYDEAEPMLNVNTNVFSQALRHRAVEARLRAAYPDVAALPVAGERMAHNDEFVLWTGSDTILAPLIDRDPPYDGDRFRWLPQHRALRLESDGPRITHAVVDDLMNWKRLRIEAETFVVACGSILTPQLLWNSAIHELPALGRYLTEHPMTFTQVVLRADVVEEIADMARRERQAALSEDDPVPIPMHDPAPMLWLPCTPEREWHAQIHRDSFSYGALPPDIDDRLVVDLRFFAQTDINADNRVVFDDTNRDKFGMPQPTFEFVLSERDRRRIHQMFGDMVNAAGLLGGILPGSEPQYMPPGLAAHFMGVHRMGHSDLDSVTDTNSRVWGFDNLYLGGNGMIPTSTAGNPTLTSCALAIRAARAILGAGSG